MLPRNILKLSVAKDAISCILRGGGGGGVLNKVLYGEAPPRSPTPYPFIYHFGRKGTPFIYLLLKRVLLSHTYFRKSCSSFHVVLNK